MLADGAGQNVTAAAAIAAVVENAAIAMKHVVPWEVTRRNTVDTAQQIAAARQRFGGAGPPGTTRKPATAANAVAVTPRTNDSSCPGSTRFAMMDPAVAARANNAAMTARLLAGELPPSEPYRTETHRPQTCDGANTSGRLAVAIRRPRCIDHGVAHIATDGFACLCLDDTEEQDVAVANAVLVQCHRLIQHGAAEL